jgi:hypothetical protein
MRSISKKLFVIIVLFVLTSCASVPLAPPAQDVASKQFIAPEGKGLIYVIRPMQLTAAGMNITPIMDKQLIGALKVGSYAMLEVNPGKHKIALGGTGFETFNALEIDVEAGGIYFFKAYPKFGVWAARAGLEQIDEEEGKSLVREYQLIQTL